MDDISPRTTQFWGKGQPAQGATVRCHPLLAHMLDVAAVAELLVTDEPAWLPPPMLRLLVALHDVGKLSRAFQAKVPELWPEAAFGPWPGSIADPGHDSLGLQYLLDRSVEPALETVLPGWNWRERTLIFGSVVGHHGRPVDDGPSVSKRDPALPFVSTVVQHLTTCFDPSPFQPLDDERDVTVLVWRLAGVTMLADWIGSSQRHFPYAAPDAVADPRTYWETVARPRARDAVRDAGLAPARARSFGGMAELFPGRVAAPGTAQAWAEMVGLPDGPILAVIEDVTGSGKTEAALTLAHRLMAAGRANGLFLALPTMATANAMYRRLADAYRNLFDDTASPSLALAHGRAALDQRFTQSILRAHADADEAASDDPADESASAQCAAWLADDRRLALLAQVGVGTVDQAFLAVLPVRHAPLRQRGLARKVLIIDEAHAFDSYMREEMLALLRFHAAMGGSVILLSATLPLALRQKLADAFRDGLGLGRVPVVAAAYPLVTLVARDGVVETPVLVRPGLARSVPVTRLDDADAAIGRIMAAARAGAAVAWVRNTVDEAIEAAARLRAQGLEPLLFHARFALVDRLAIEDEVLRRFGRESSGEQRRAVLVATQVIEQSLDLDFDLMVSDLAPVDLLIQRAGRLWRHGDRAARPLPAPELLVVSPEPVDDPPTDWLAGHHGTAAVYRDPALLWRGARALFGAGAINSPEDLRALIEAAAEGDIPTGLAVASGKSQGKASAAGAIGRQNVLDFSQGYTRAAGVWDSDMRTPTRLEDQPQVTLRLGRLRDGKVVPYAEAFDPRRAWALSEVSVAANKVKECPLPADLAAAVAAVRATWGRWEREAPLLKLAVLEGASPPHRFAGIDDKGIRRTWRYDSRVGIHPTMGDE